MAATRLQSLRVSAEYAGGSQFDAAAQKNRDSLTQLGAAARGSGEALQQSGQKLAASSGSYERLARRIDPAYRAQQQFAAGEKILQRALDQGRITANEYGLRIGQLQAKYDVAGQQAQRFAGQQAQATGNSRAMGMAVQQAGFQVGDFATQVASGQGVLRPFIQQGTQLVSMFGPWGAVIGAAGAVVGALAVSLWDTGDAGAAAKDTLELLEEATAALNDETERSVELNRQQALGLLRKAEAAEAAARAELHELDVFLQKRQAELDATRASAFIAGTEAPAGFLQGDIDAARERMNDVGANADQARVTIQQLRATLSGLGSDYAAQVAANDNLIAAWGKSAREAEIVAKTAEILKGNFAGTEEQARALAERLVDQEARLKDLSKRHEDAAKATDKEREAMERRERAGQAYLASIETENAYLRLKLTGQEDLIPLLEAEAKLRETLGRELLPEEAARVRELTTEHERLNAEVERREEIEKKVQKAAEDAARETQRVWERAGEGIQDALVDAVFEGENAFDSLKNVALRTAKEIAAAMIFRPIFSPVIMNATGQGGIPGQAGGVGGLGGIGGLGDLASLGGSAWGWISSLFGGDVSAGAAGGFNPMGAAGVASAGGLPAFNPMGISGSAGGMGGLQGAFAAVPVWGWIAAAASMIKGMTAGSAPNSAMGALDTLLLPSLEQWQMNPGRSLYNALNPIGTVARDFGAPAWAGDMFGPDPLGGILTAAGLPEWLTPGGLLSGLFGGQQPSNKHAQVLIDTAARDAGDPIFDPSERSQKTIDAATAMSQAFLHAASVLEQLSGGTGAAGAFVVAGERDGIQVGIGREGINLANSREYGQMGSFRDPEQAIAWMVREFARSLEGVTDEDAARIIRRGTARGKGDPAGAVEEMNQALTFLAQYREATAEPVLPTVSAMLEDVNEKWAAVIKQAKEFGIATDDAVAARRREITAIREDVNRQRFGFQMSLNRMEMGLEGDYRGVYAMDLEISRQSQLQSAKQLLDAEIITAQQFTQLSELLDRQVTKSLEDFDKAARDAAQSAANDNAARDLPYYQQSYDAAASLSGFLDRQLLSEASSLNPQQKIAEAQSQYDALLAAVQGGDLGQTQALTQSAETLLGLSRESYSSSPAFAAVEDRIRRELAALGQTITSDAFLLQQIADGQREIGLENVKAIEKLGEKLDALEKTFEKAFRLSRAA